MIGRRVIASLDQTRSSRDRLSKRSSSNSQFYKKKGSLKRTARPNNVLRARDSCARGFYECGTMELECRHRIDALIAE